MLKGIVNDKTAKIVHGALDGLSTRQRAISNNIANVDTPGYKAVEVSFEDQLKQLMNRQKGIPVERTDPKHLPVSTQSFSPKVSQSTNLSYRNDGNNVDVEREMADLAETTIAYTAMTRLASGRLSLLRSIISGSR